MTREDIPKEWQPLLQHATATPGFDSLCKFVNGRRRQTTVYPPQDRVFAALQLCAPQDVRVVILGQDPYHGPGQANGLAFAVNPGVKLPPSLRNILAEVACQTGRPADTDSNLERWARQGVLLLNTVLTVEDGKPTSHTGHGWEQLTDAVIAAVAALPHPVVFMLWGAHAQKKAALINETRHLVLTSAHPSPLSARRGFFGNNHFIKANRWLGTPIDW